MYIVINLFDQMNMMTWLIFTIFSANLLFQLADYYTLYYATRNEFIRFEVNHHTTIESKKGQENPEPILVLF